MWLLRQEVDVCFRMNSHVVRFLERRKKNASALRNGAATNAELEDGCDATAVLLKKGKVTAPKTPSTFGAETVTTTVASHVEVSLQVSDFHSLIALKELITDEDVAALRFLPTDGTKTFI